MNMPKNEDLIYTDEKYSIYLKDAGVLGSIDSSVEIIMIGIRGPGTLRETFANKSEYREMIKNIVEELEKTI